MWWPCNRTIVYPNKTSHALKPWPVTYLLSPLHLICLSISYICSSSALPSFASPSSATRPPLLPLLCSPPNFYAPSLPSLYPSLTFPLWLSSIPLWLSSPLSLPLSLSSISLSLPLPSPLFPHSDQLVTIRHAVSPWCPSWCRQGRMICRRSCAHWSSARRSGRSGAAPCPQHTPRWGWYGTPVSSDDVSQCSADRGWQTLLTHHFQQMYPASSGQILLK